MKPLVLALSAACLALALAACGGNDGAKSAGPAPSVPVETAPPATSRGGTAERPTDRSLRDYSAQIVEYVAQADAICKTATDKLEAALAELPEAAADRHRRERLEGRAGLYGTAYEGLAYELSGEALAQLRALPPPEAGAVNPVAMCSHRGGWQESASGPTRAEFIAQAREICRAAESRGQTNPEESTARIMAEALAQLRAIPQPEADRALLEEGYYEVLEQEIYTLREYAVAAAAGDIAREFLLGSERVHLTHQRNGFELPYGLAGCMGLPA